MILNHDRHTVEPDEDLMTFLEALGEWLTLHSAKDMRTSFNMEFQGEKITYQIEIKELNRIPKIIEGEATDTA